jgi:hypothetical protein
MPATVERLKKRGRTLVAPALWLAFLAGGCACLGASHAVTPDAQAGTSRAFSLRDSASAPTASKGVQTAQAPQPDINCPAVEVRRGAATLVVASSGERTAMGMKYQGSFVRVARECGLVEGNMAMKVGVEGRIVLGPAGSPGRVDVPLRFAVVQETPSGGMRPITTKFVVVPVDVGATGNTPFIYVEEALTFPIPTPTSVVDEYIVYVGFDPVSAEARAKAPKEPPKAKSKTESKTESKTNPKPNPKPNQQPNQQPNPQPSAGGGN